MIAIVAGQLALSRGERLDWFNSPEVIAEMLIAGIAFYLFVVNTMTAERPFIDRALFRNRNYVISLFFLLIFGAIIILPNILLPLLLQQLAGYPATQAGFVLIPRGIGVIVGLLLIGQIEHRVDARMVIFLCLIATVYTAWEMAHWNVDVRPWEVIWPNLIQGIASGMMWVPVSALALGTLDKRLQAEGYAIFYLQFDIGSAVGVAGVIAIHTRQTQATHAMLAEHVNPFNELFQYPAIAEIWDLAEASALAALDHEVTRQAAMIAYNNSFVLLAIGTAALIPTVFFFRPTRPGAGGH